MCIAYVSLCVCFSVINHCLKGRETMTIPSFLCAKASAE